MAEQPSKKRRNDVEIDQDNWDKDSQSGEEAPQQQGEFERATPEELAKRRKIVVARGPDGAAVPKGSNPFANVSVAAKPSQSKQPEAPATAAAAASEAAAKPAEAAKVDAKAAAGDAAAESSSPATDAAAKADPPATTGGFGSLSAKGGGFQFGGGGFGAGNGTFGSGGAATGTSSSMFGGGGFGGFGGGGFGSGGFGGGSIFGAKAGAEAADGEDDNPSSGSLFGAGGGTVQLFSAKAEGAGVEEGGKPAVVLPNERPVTGEEDEMVLFSADASLFVFGADKAWKERGKGEVKVNRALNGNARILMRQKGNYRLMLNAQLFPAMSVQVMEGGRGVTFNCVNAALTDDPATSRKAPAESTSPSAAAADKLADKDMRAADAKGTEEGANADAERLEADANSAAAAAKEGQDEGGAAAAPAQAMALHALRLRPSELQEQFVRILNEHKMGAQPAADDGHWVPPV